MVAREPCWRPFSPRPGVWTSRFGPRREWKGWSARAEGFRLHTSRGPLAADRVVLATGGRSLPKTGSNGAGYALAESLGHSVTRQTPALVPLVLEDGLHLGLSGVAVEVELTILGASKPRRLRGPLLFTHFGVSGPVVLDASRHWCQARARGPPASSR